MDCEAETVRPFLRPDDRLYVSGVGKVNAAAATMKAICEGADEIWNVGLSGGFGADVAVGDIYRVRIAVEYDFDLAKLNGTAIGVLNEYDTPYLELDSPASLVSRLASCPWCRGEKILATGDRFNDSEADNTLISETLGASRRDMVGAAIAHVCKRFGVKCLALKCVSDVAGRGAMTVQYAVNKRFCLEKLTQAMKEII